MDFFPTLLTDASNPDVILKYLRTIKHTRLEGLVIEHEFDQTYNPYLISCGWKPVDALVLRRLTSNKREELFILPREKTETTDILIDGLKKTHLPVRQLEMGENENILVLHDKNGIKLNDPISLKYNNKNDLPGVPNPTAESRNSDDERIIAAYWGFGKYQGEKFSRFVRDLVIKDHYLSREKEYLWDLDRFYVLPDDSIVYIEVKHKFPSKKGTFGMNNGEVQQAKMLARSGLSPWHVILVKPYYDKKISSLYLFVDRPARENAFWIAGNMSAGNFFSGGSGYANSKTGLYGNAPVKYTDIPLSSFSIIGPNSDTASVLSINLMDLINNQGFRPALTQQTLQKYRLK